MVTKLYKIKTYYGYTNTDTFSQTITVADLDCKILDVQPPWGPNSFHFMQLLGKFDKILCWHPLEGWYPHLKEILDLPLNYTKQLIFLVLLTFQRPVNENGYQLTHPYHLKQSSIDRLFTNLAK